MKKSITSNCPLPQSQKKQIFLDKPVAKAKLSDNAFYLISLILLMKEFSNSTEIPKLISGK